MRKQLILTLAVATALPLVQSGCATTSSPNYPGYSKASPMEKVGSSIKSGTSKMAAVVTPKKKSADNAVAETTNKKPGANVFVTTAQLAEQRGNLDEAEAQYNKALDIDPNHLEALVGYAHLHDRQSKFEAATKLYQRALKKYPKEAALHNDLGLCYHRRAMLPEASKSLHKAVDLKPDRKLYRDNLAAILVDQGKKPEALKQLVYAHGEAVGNYNLAYLLVQKKNNTEAIEHFRVAAQKDPSLAAAQQWIAKLSATTDRVADAGQHGTSAVFASDSGANPRFYQASAGTPAQQVAAQPSSHGVPMPPTSEQSTANRPTTTLR